MGSSGALAIVLTCVLGMRFVYFMDRSIQIARGMSRTLGHRRTAFVLGMLAPMVFVLACYGILTRYFGPRVPRDGETRCHRCQYILRGISEPRCPECGERI